MSNTTYINPSEVRRALEILHPDGELFEIRVIQGKNIYSGYFKDIDIAIAELEKLTDYHLRDANVYSILGRINDACFGRKQHNRIILSKVTTGDGDATGFKWLFIDFDPKRPSDTSSTDQQLADAKLRAEQVYAYLKKKGFPEPLVGMSGNGYHLLYKIDMPKTETETIRKFLQAMANLYSDEIIDIDTGNFNPARPCKLYGTLAQKGSGTEEQPHRMSYIVQAPEKFEIVSLDLIKKIIEESPIKEKEKRQYDSYNGGNNTNSRRGLFTEEEFEAWMQAHNISYTAKKRYDTYIGYVLEGGCLFEESHTGTCAMLTLGYDGIPGYQCKHINTCGDKKFRDVRMLKEPEFYSWHPSNYDEDDGRIDSGWAEHRKMMAQSRAQNIENKEENTENKEEQTQIEEDIPLTGPVTPTRTFRKLKSAADLLKKELPKTKAFWGVGDKAPLLKEGTCILSAKPKLGKSWLAMGLCLAAVNGMDFIGRKMEQCSALYLDLESSEELQQERLKDMLEATPEYGQGLDRFYLETTTDRIGMGLEEQIESYMTQDPTIGIVVIDVFQGVRTAAVNFKESEYDHAYRDIKPLNLLAEKYHISIILVYHNRKSVDPDDPFSNILGSVGSQAAVAQMIVMYRQRENDPIHIAINGRSIRGRQDLDAEFKDGAWASVDAGNSADREKARLLQEYMESPIRKGVLALMRENSMWKGRCSSIIGDAVQLGVPITDTAKSVGGFLHRHQGRLLEMDGIKLQIIQSGTASKTYKFTIADQDPEPDEDSLQAPFIDMGYGEI